jgi:hypothetical protein
MPRRYHDRRKRRLLSDNLRVAKATQLKSHQSNEESLTRYANNIIHQNVAGMMRRLPRVSFDKQSGIVTNRMDEAGLMSWLSEP